MEKIMMVIAGLSLISGVLLLFIPQRLAHLSQVVSRPTVSVDKQVTKYHIGVGLCLIGASFFLFLYGYYMVLR